MFRPQAAVAISIAFISTDILTSIFALGFYHKGIYLDDQNLADNLLLKNGYDWFSSPFDFVAITSIRSLLLLLSLILYLQKKRVSNIDVALGFNYLAWTYGLIKFLALSDKSQLHLTFGCYYSMFWNMLASTLAAWLWCYGLHCEKLPKCVESIINSVHNICPILVRPTSGHVDCELLVNEEQENIPKLSTFKTTLKLINYCRYHSFWFISSFIYSAIFSISLVTIPYCIGTLVSDLVKGGGVAAVLKSILIIGGLSLLASFFGGCRWGSAEYASALIHRKMRSDLFRSLVYQEMSFFDDLQTGEITSRLSSDVEKMASVMSTNFNVLLRVTLMLGGSFGFMFALSWRLSFVSFILIPLIGMLQAKFGMYFDKIGEQDQETIAEANKKADEIISSMKTVKSFASEEKEITKFESHLDKTLVVKKTKAVGEVIYTWFTELCYNFILVFIISYGGYLVLSKNMSPEDLINYLLYALQINYHIMDFGWVFFNIMGAVGSSRKVFEYIDREPKIPKIGKDKPVIEGKVTFNNVSFSYPSRPNQIVLNNLSIEADAGTIVALVGPSGAGKSSIISLLKRFYLPTEGEILLDGKNIDNFDNDYYNKKIVLVGQNPILFGGTVRENILYGCENGTDQEMIKAAKLANCHDFIMETELGYDSICGEKGCLFSGGQVQRLCIARVLVLKCKIILLDESTSAMDSHSEAVVQDAIYKNLKDKTVFVIAHRLSTIEKANKIYVINKGQVEQVGNHQELMQDSEGTYYSLVQKQKLANKQQTNIIQFDDSMDKKDYIPPSSPVICSKSLGPPSPCEHLLK